MKKRTFFLLAAAAALPALNCAIFKKGAGLGMPIGKFYNWRFGKVHYTKTGEGRPLLLVHGIKPGCGSHDWEEYIGSLSKSFTVYAIDLLGMGYSDKPNTSYSAYMYARLVSDFVKDIIKEPAFVCASSHGAAYAVLAATLNKKYFEKMVLIEPTGGELPKPECVFLKYLLESPVIGSSIYAALSSKLFCKLNQAAYNAAHYKGINAKYAYAAYLSKFLNANISDKVSQLKIPVYVADKSKTPKELFRICNGFLL